MVAFHSEQQSFASGVLSPALAHKPGSSVYATGLLDCVNAVISREGSVIRRPSSRFVARTSGASRLLRFTAVAGLEWVIELGSDQKVRFYSQQGFLSSPGSSTPLALGGLPYSSTELNAVQLLAVGNQAYLLHENHIPRLLTYNPGANPLNTAPWTLSIPAFSGLMSGKKPSCGVAYGQRLVFSGFLDQPGRFLFSRTPDEDGNLRLTDFTSGADDDHALDFTTARGEAVYWLLERDSGILFGTHSGMYILSSRSPEQALSGTNAKVNRQSPLPIGTVPPQEMDQAFFVAHNSLRDVLQAQYSFDLAGIQTESQTVNASHLFTQPITDMAFSQSEGLLWLLIDGALISLSFWRETEIRAFTRHDFGGSTAAQGTASIVQSFAVVNGALGDQLWLCVERGGVFSIEFMQFNEVLSMPHHLDSAVYKNTGGTSITGLEHLEGQAVQVVGGYGEETQTVVSGTVSVERSSPQIAAGYAFETRITFLPPRAGASNLRNSARTTLLTDVEIAATASSGFNILCHQGEGRSSLISAYSSVHDGGVGVANFSRDTVYHTHLPSDYDHRAYLEIVTTSARPLNLHRISTRGEVE